MQHLQTIARNPVKSLNVLDPVRVLHVVKHGVVPGNGSKSGESGGCDNTAKPNAA